MHVIKVILFLVVGLYALAVIIMYTAQRRFMYFPDPRRTLPAAVGLPDVVERVIATPDGERIIAWYGKARPGQPTLLYFHGNGGALETRAERIRAYLDLGRGVYMMSYRGYSGSSGSPSEAANVADALLAYDDLAGMGVAPQDIIIYGESLGTGVGVQVARVKKIAGIVLDSPFTSIVDRAAQLYPWLPARVLLRDRYDSLSVIGEIHAPLLVIHGDADDIVPVEMGRHIFERANEPKEIKVLRGAGHVDHSEYGSFELINEWIDRITHRRR
jgi:fermentation-respiration switch protein FrsA (DUF1100 family)